jgi:hypothetical protein
MQLGRFRFAAALLCALFLSPLATAQIHKDEVRGFQFKPPKDFNAVALKPGERLIVAKYQDPSTSYGGEQGYAGYNSQFVVRYFSYDASDDEGDEEYDPMEGGLSFLEAMYGYYEVDKDKKITIARAKGREMYITPANGSIKVWCAMLPQDDGLFLFEGTAIDKRFDKELRDFSKAAKTFKRIDKADTSARDAELSQMDSQERFLQTQINKLPPGWDYIRTDRYLFLYNADKNFVKGMSEQIEKIRNVYEDLYPPTEPIEDVSIVRVCNSRDEYMAYGGSAGSGGYWSPYHKELVFFDQSPRTETLCVLNHEAFHQYIYYYYGELSPHSWYNEGHGDYFSGAKMTRTYRITEYANAPGGFDRSQFIKDMARLRQQGKKMSEGAAAPLKELLNYSQREYYSSGPGRPVGFYPQGWAVVHMLRQSKGLEPEWKRILPEYLANLVASRHEVAEEVMKKKLETAEKVKEGSSEDLSHDVEDYYGRVDTDKVQKRAYEKTFVDWSDADWEAFDEFFLKYCEKL